MLSILLYKEYTFELPYNYNRLNNFFFSIIPNESIYSWTWIFLLLASILLTLPLLKKKIIGILGFGLLIVVVCKPIFIKKTPVQNAISFLEPRKKEMKELIDNIKQSKNPKFTFRKIKQLGFEQIQKEGDTYIFIVQSFRNNGFGFCYDEDGNFPKGILSATAKFERIDLNWFKISF